MALFQIIRTKLGPIIVIIIGLAMALFILETALNSNTSLLQGNRNVVGNIDGKNVEIQDFQNRVEESITNYKLQTQQKNIDDNTLYSIRDQTWNQIIANQISSEEYSKLGLNVSTEELKDMFFGKEPIPEIKSAFTNPQTGVFDPLAVKNYYDHLDETGEGEQEGERRIRWVAFEKDQKEKRLIDKYSGMLKSAVYIPKWQAESDYNEKNTRASVNFVMVPYAGIVDSTIKITDAELQNYLNAHKEQYKQEESRKVEYVLFNVDPSADDTVRVAKQINEIFTKLAAAPSDTDYLKLNSDKGLDKFYYKSASIPSEYVKDTLMKIPVGSIVGPYFEDNNYRIAKLMSRKEVADSVSAHHILIRVDIAADSMKAKNKIDSIYNAIKNGTSFDSLAVKFSEDKGSGEKGGELGFMQQGKTVTNFNQYLFFEGKPGEMKIVKTEFGYHLIRIDEVKNVSAAVQVNFITRPLEASSETDKSVFEKATKFASDNSTMDAFYKSVDAQKLNKLLAPNVQKSAYQLPGLQSAREIVKWAYEAKLGDVSSPFSFGSTYVVATLSGVKEKGTMSVEDAKQQLEMQVRKEKKGEQISAQIAAAMALNTTLEALGTKLNQPVKNSSNVSFGNAYSENLGFEPKVVGTVFNLKEKELSKPVAGEQGVYVVQVQTIAKPQPIADYNQFKQQLLQTIQPRLQYGYNDALKKAITIEDYRNTFF